MTALLFVSPAVAFELNALNGGRAGLNHYTGKFPIVGRMARLDYPQSVCNALFVAALAIEAVKLGNQVPAEERRADADRKQTRSCWERLCEVFSIKTVSHISARGRQGLLFAGILRTIDGYRPEIDELARHTLLYNAYVVGSAGADAMESCVAYGQRELFDDADLISSITIPSIRQIYRKAAKQFA